MSAEIERIALTLGQLQEGQRRTDIGVGQIMDQLSILSTDMVSMKDVGRRLDKIETQVDSFSQLKQRGIGIMAGVALAGGSLGAMLRDMLHKI